MKIVKVSKELGIDNMDDEVDFSNKESVAEFLNHHLFGCNWVFSAENIESIRDVE